jgi:hypothetical protein
MSKLESDFMPYRTKEISKVEAHFITHDLFN